MGRNPWMVALFCIVLAPLAAAQENAEDEFDFLDAKAPKKEEIGAFDQVTEEFSFEEETAADGTSMPRVRHRFAQTGLTFAGMTPLSDPMPPRVTHSEPDAVVVQVPVLIAKDGVGPAQPYRLHVALYLNDQHVTRMSQEVAASSVANTGPSYALFTAWVPTRAPKGTLKAVVARSDVVLAEPIELYTTQSVFHRPVSVEDEVVEAPVVSPTPRVDDGFGDGFLDDDDDLEFED